MIDLFDSWFSRFCSSDDHNYGSPEIKTELQEESKETAAKDTAAIIEEQKAAKDPASPTSEQKKITPKPKKTTPLPGLMYPDDVKALTDKYGVLCG